MNRRYLLGTVLAAAAASRRRAAAASDQVNLAIIGVGSRGRAMINDFRRIQGTRIHTICDVDHASLEKAMAVIEKYNMPKPQMVTDVRRVLDDKGIDSVSIATPDH